MKQQVASNRHDAKKHQQLRGKITKKPSVFAGISKELASASSLQLER